jgi:hypothetical protein
LALWCFSKAYPSLLFRFWVLELVENIIFGTKVTLKTETDKVPCN